MPADPSAGPPERTSSFAWAVTVVAGAIALVGALVLPFAPVAVNTSEVRWPVDPRDTTPTMLMLTAYEPAELDVRFSCRAARSAAATPDGFVLSTMGPRSPDAADEALTVVARGDAVTVRSGGSVLFAGPLPPGDCRFVVAGDAAAVRVVLDGVVVSTTGSRLPVPDPEEDAPDEEEPLPDREPIAKPISPLPEVDALRTSVPPLPDAGVDDLSVRLVLDTAFDHTPSAAKSVLVVVIVMALVAGAVALPAGRAPPEWGARGLGRLVRWLRRRATRTVARARTLRPRVVDVLVPAVLLAWLFLAPITDDDGYYGAMAANVPFSGYLPNYYQLYDQGYTPFSWPYYALSWWQTTVGTAPVLVRIPALVLGLGTWWLARAYVARTPLGGTGRWTSAAARTGLAAAFLAGFLAYDMGSRPEPVVMFFALAALVAVAEGLERRRLALLGLAVGAASAGLMAAPTGFIALAPLVAAAPATWRLVRARSASWWAVAGCWIVVLAPLAVGSLLGFADGAYRDFVRSQEIFAPIQRAQTWYQELLRYNALLDTASHHGSYARRALILACLLALVWFLVLVVATRARGLAVPARLPLVGWSTLLAFVLLLPTPSKPTHHLGAFAGLGAVFLALLLVVGPRLVAALDREHRVPQPALVAVALSAVATAALVGHGRAMWPYGWGLGMPSYGDYPSVRGIEFDQPLWWALALVLITVVVVLVGRAPWRRLALAVSVPVLVVALLAAVTVWTVGDVTRAAIRTADGWSPQIDGWTDPVGDRCGLGGQMDVLDPAGGQALAPVPLPGGAPSEPLVPLDAPDAPAPETRTEPFLPGAFFPPSPPPRGLPGGTPVWGSFLVPEDGATADARTGGFATGWYRTPPPAEAGMTVAVAGRTARDVSLRVEYGRETPDGVVPLDTHRLAEDDPESVTWRTVALVDEAAPPPGANAVRLLADDASTSTGGWSAFSAPVAHRWVPLPDYLPAGGAVGIAWQIRTYFPCLRQPRQQAGITEPAVAAIGYGDTVEAARADWMFNPARGGLLGHAEREGPGTLLTTRVRDVGDAVDDVYLVDLRQPYPSDGYVLTRDRRVESGLSAPGVDAADLRTPPPPAAG
ncbi:arabinosyltransferase domain-containing protein [Actinomycetospora straminea]|uniref:arabinosyltransferase domain-containing protein n=1 Tax=Actinomycetospora straminea TaxID=663607 RepID=UPI002366D142|nr:arabinosyltransferase domain-containing protein [Actinomycetospora straminea]MDD7934649.1 arabinosyltransferase domain-containing protein [Actinomycetospora straminea]